MDDLKDRVSLDDRLGAAAMSGITMAVWADLKPDAIFIHDPDGKTHSWGKVNAQANRIVRLLRQHGLTAGDSVALVCSNRAEFVEVLTACQRGGWRITPVNWHLTADEIAYIINDCEAKALIAETRYPAALAASTPNVVLKLSVGADAILLGTGNRQAPMSRRGRRPIMLLFWVVRYSALREHRAAIPCP